jgi:hypothetical protein
MAAAPGKVVWNHLAALPWSIGPSEPMQNDQTSFFSDIFLKFYNIIEIII